MSASKTYWAIALAAMLCASVPAGAATRYWTGNTSVDNDWLTGGNWTGGIVPGSSDHARINAGSSLASPVRIAGAATPYSLKLGEGSADAGYLLLSSGSLATATSQDTYVGDAGTGYFKAAGGTFSTRELHVGQQSGSSGTVVVESGATSFAAGRDTYIGYAGMGSLLASASISLASSGGGVTLGYDSTGSGTLKLLNSSTNLALGTGKFLKVGVSGTGLFEIRGGTVSSGGVGQAEQIVVRDQSSATGTFQGYGTFSMGGGIKNNGRIIADGFAGAASDVTLDLSALDGYGGPSVINSIENTTNNGWYAQNRAKLTLAGLGVAAGNSSVNWGEQNQYGDGSVYADDATIDLVNSVHATFAGVSSAGTLSGSLLASDRSDVAAAPSGITFIGVWELSFNRAFTSVDLQFRYDDAAAGGNTPKLYHYTGGNWTELNSTVLSGNRIETTGLTSLSQFAVGVIPEPATAAVLVLGGLGVLLRRRRG
ncbi:MAG TPA: hypothetical protein DCX07_03415 [Phycisphaerales bacterium]|nr:hypothetical protein [Phycisphaerales bacterium]